MIESDIVLVGRIIDCAWQASSCMSIVDLSRLDEKAAALLRDAESAAVKIRKLSERIDAGDFLP